MTENNFEALLNSDEVTQPTRNVLEQRLARPETDPAFFNQQEFDLLQSVCDVLLAQDPENRMVDLAGIIDQRLKANEGIGWRYSKLPVDGVAYQTGLKGIAESALLLHHKNFEGLSPEEKKTLLKTVQQGEAVGETWKDLSGKLFFELILTDATEQFYSHPEAQFEIKYTGFADAKGWQVPQLKTEN